MSQFFYFKFVGLCVFFIILSKTIEEIIEGISDLAKSGTVADFTMVAFLLSVAIGVIWTSIKETEERAKDKIDELNKHTEKIDKGLRKKGKHLNDRITGLNKKVKILEKLEQSVDRTISTQNQLIDTLSLIELKSIGYTKYFQRLNEYTARSLTTKNKRFRAVCLNRLVEFFEVDIDDVRVLNGFLDEFILLGNQLLIQNDSNASHYLERLVKYYEYKKQTEKKEDIENILKLIRLCKEIKECRIISDV